MSESKRPRGKYKTTNWADYNASLKARGSLTVWLDKDMQWYATVSGKRGRQRTFSDAAIQFFADNAKPSERFKFTLDRVGREEFYKKIKEAYNG